MLDKDLRQELEMESLEEEISDLERLSADSEFDELGTTPAPTKPAPPRRFSLREMASSLMSKLTGHLQAKVHRTLWTRARAKGGSAASDESEAGGRRQAQMRREEENENQTL